MARLNGGSCHIRLCCRWRAAYRLLTSMRVHDQSTPETRDHCARCLRASEPTERLAAVGIALASLLWSAPALAAPTEPSAPATSPPTTGTLWGPEPVPSKTESAGPSAQAPGASVADHPGSAAPAPADASPTSRPTKAAPQLAWPDSGDELADDRPETLGYTPGAAIPDGYRLQTYLPRGYIIGGSITFGVGAALGLGSALSSHDKDFQSNWLFLPVLGPFVAMLTVHETCTPGVTGPIDCRRSDATFNFLAVIGTMQAVGATLFTWGLTHPKQRLVRIEKPELTFTLAPMGRSGYGLATAGTF
jgi:hypothetical protein